MEPTLNAREPSKAEIAAFFDSLQELADLCGPTANRNDRALVLIEACIAEGRDTRGLIIGTLRKLGFDPRHVAALLDDCCGAFAESHRWRLGADGRYTLHRGEAAVETSQ